MSAASIITLVTVIVGITAGDTVCIGSSCSIGPFANRQGREGLGIHILTSVTSPAIVSFLSSPQISILFLQRGNFFLQTLQIFHGYNHFLVSLGIFASRAGNFALLAGVASRTLDVALTTAHTGIVCAFLLARAVIEIVG